LFVLVDVVLKRFGFPAEYVTNTSEVAGARRIIKAVAGTHERLTHKTCVKEVHLTQMNARTV
jgi:hypothetical protein